MSIDNDKHYHLNSALIAYPKCTWTKLIVQFLAAELPCSRDGQPGQSRRFTSQYRIFTSEFHFLCVLNYTNKRWFRQKLNNSQRRLKLIAFDYHFTFYLIYKASRVSSYMIVSL